LRKATAMHAWRCFETGSGKKMEGHCQLELDSAENGSLARRAERSITQAASENPSSRNKPWAIEQQANTQGRP
jgi:hypothetical protein